MRLPVLLHLQIIALIALAPVLTHAQTNTEKIKATWVVERFEPEKNTPQAIQAKQELTGVCLIFGKEELTITRKTETGDSILKKGPYVVSGNSITLGKSQATILTLSGKQLTIQVPKQGVLYLAKM